MKSFKVYLAEDNHNHLDFEKQYTCFAAYLGRQRQSGDKSALKYVINLKQLRHEYDEHLLQITVSISRTSASNIVNNSVEQYASGSEGSSIPSFSAARTPLHDRGSGSSSPTLSPPHRPLFDVDSDENEREQDEVADGGAAINVLDDHEDTFGDKKAEADERPSNNIFDGPVAAAETGDMSWIQRQPAFTFSLPLTKDWGPQVTEAYNKIKKMKSLNYKQVDEIAQYVLSTSPYAASIQRRKYTELDNGVCELFNRDWEFFPHLRFACAKILAGCFLLNNQSGQVVIANTIEVYGRTRLVDAHREPFIVRKGQPVANSLPPSIKTPYKNVWPTTVSALDGERLIIGTLSFDALVTSSLRLDTRMNANVGCATPSFLLCSTSHSLATKIFLDQESLDDGLQFAK
ncbi:hypothetical protein BGZ89_006530, partial [Linnemannia elongata]